MRSVSRFWLALSAVTALVATGCGVASVDGQSDVVVSAAASLSDAFSDIETAFELANPEFDVLLNVAGSAALREQILEGAPADVFAPANPEVMVDVVEAGEVGGSPQIFAANSMVIAVPEGNPGGVTGLNDLEREDLFVGLCSPSVPCGSLARQVLADAGIDPSLDTNEPDVRSLLLKIGLGEVDVGLVYVTDAIAAASSVDSIQLPPQHTSVVLYPIAALAASPNPVGGEAFLRFVLSEQGSDIMERHGFVVP